MSSRAIRIVVAALAFALADVDVALARQVQPKPEPAAAPAEVPKIGETPLTDWLAKWRAQTPAERRAMLDRLQNGTEELPNGEAYRSIAELLSAPDAETREVACGLLVYGSIGNDREGVELLMPKLAAAVKDAVPRVRLAAARSLAAIAWTAESHGPSFTLAMDELIALASSDDAALRLAALRDTWGYGRVEPKLVPLYVSALKSGDVERRRIAAEGLGTALGKFEEARAPLREALADGDATVRFNAVRALTAEGENSDEVASVAIALCSESETALRSQAIWCLGNLGVERASETLPILVAALNDGEAEVRAQAASALGNLGSSDHVDSPEAAARLAELTRDESGSVRSAAAWALGHVGATAEIAVPALAALITDPIPDARNNALASLEQAGAEVVLALPQLIAALKNPDASVRTWVAKLIGLGGERSQQATDALIERLADPSVNVRVWSAYALRSIGAPAAAAIPRLVKSLGEDPEPKLRVEAARALAAFGPLAGAAVDALVAACRDPDADVRLWSLFALGELKVKSDAIVATLKEAAASSDERVVVEANKALEKLGEEHDAKAVANAPGAPADLPVLAAPITYQGFALVLVDGGGAAVVTFFDETHESSKAGGRDGVKYRYRYLAKGQAEPTTGEGEAFSILRNTDSALRVEDYAASHSRVDAGPLRVGWSNRGPGSAFVYWKPETLTVTLASAIDFETLDLRRFLH